jgi:hypothetical protein
MLPAGPVLACNQLADYLGRVAGVVTLIRIPSPYFSPEMGGFLDLPATTTSA